MAVKKPTLKCGQCARIDRDTYKGARVLVCYHIKKINDDPVAITVTDKRAACGYFRQV